MVTHSSDAPAAEGLVNLRDLGGLPIEGGGVTRRGRLLRSESLHSLSQAGIDSLLALGVATVVDLRTESERQVLPSPLATHDAVRTHHAPIFRDDDDFPRHLARASEVYRWWLRERPGGFAAALSAVAAAESAPILVHCHAGKDRTGVIVALLLRLAGVGVEAIADDYAVSGVQLAEMLTRDRARAVEAGMDEVRVERLFTVRREEMVETVAAIDGEHRGAARYMRDIGLDEAQVARLARLLTAPDWP